MPRWNLSAKPPWILRGVSFKILVIFVLTSVGQFYIEGQVTWPDTVIRHANSWLHQSTKNIDLTSFEHLDLPSVPGIEPASPSPSGDRVTIIRVIDGDTVELLGGERVRLQGIDTPERSQHYGQQATDSLQQMLSGDVRLKRIETDRYGRTIGVLFVAGREVNLAMVCAGHAWHYEQYARNRDDMARCQRQAKAAQLGLWSAPSPTPPWEYRRK